MMVFNELVKNGRMQDPEERKAEDLKHAPGDLKVKSGPKKSVSLRTVRITNVLVGIGLTAIILTIIGYIVWTGFKIYIG